MSFRTIAVVGLVVAAGLAGCAGSDPAAPGVSFSVGALGANYQLTAIADKALPAMAFEGTDVYVRVSGGTLALAADNSYTMSVQGVRHFISANREVSFELKEQGKWSLSRDSKNAVILTPSTGAARKATVVGDNLVFTLTVPDASPVDKATKVYRFTKH